TRASRLFAALRGPGMIEKIEHFVRRRASRVRVARKIRAFRSQTGFAGPSRSRKSGNSPRHRPIVQWRSVRWRELPAFFQRDFGLHLATPFAIMRWNGNIHSGGAWFAESADGGPREAGRVCRHGKG